MLPTTMPKQKRWDMLTHSERFIIKLSVEAANAERLWKSGAHIGNAEASAQLLRKALTSHDQAVRVARALENIYLALNGGDFYHITNYFGPYGADCLMSVVPDLDLSIGSVANRPAKYEKVSDVRKFNQNTYEDMQEILFSMYLKNEDRVAVLCHDPVFMAEVHASREGYRQLRTSISINVDKRWTISSQHKWYRRVKDGGDIKDFMKEDANAAVDKILTRLERYSYELMRYSNVGDTRIDFVSSLWGSLDKHVITKYRRIAQAVMYDLQNIAKAKNPEFGNYTTMLGTKGNAVMMRLAKGVVIYKGTPPMRYAQIDKLNVDDERVQNAHKAGALTFSMPMMRLRAISNYGQSTEFDMTERWEDGQSFSPKIVEYMQKRRIKL